MSKVRVTLLLLISLLIVVPARGQGPDKETLTRQLMKISGLEAQLNQIPQHVHAGLAEREGSLPPDLYLALSGVMAKAYDVGKIRESVSKRLAANLNIQDMQAVLRWLQSGLAQKITSLEEAASTPEAFKEMQIFAQQMQTNPPTPRRLELVQRLDDAANATKMAVDIVLFTAYGVTTALDATLPADQQTSPERIREQIESQRPQLTPLLQQMTIVSFLYTFQTLGDVEIERYVHFCESEIGERYHLVVGAAVMNALLEATERIRAELIRVLKDLPRRNDA